MHPLFKRADGLTEQVIGAATGIHRDKGPGLMQCVYEWCLQRGLELRKLHDELQRNVGITYKGFTCEEPLRFDLLVDGCLLVEIKSVESVLPIHKAQIMTFMKLLEVPVGLLINFNSPKVTDGVCRLILPGSIL
ncbi:MAG TPA: GxxExxY protein [Lacunisphaera sp.]|nr:GxxExxY protein [Lacunisphaera sp.]